MERRKRYLIDRSIQLSFLKFVLTLVAIVSLFFGFFLVQINSYMTDYILTSLEQTSHPTLYASSASSVADFRHDLFKRDMRFLVQIAAAIVFLGLLISLITIRFTHRFAGPIYRFNSVLDRFLQGDTSPRIVLRKWDYLKDTADKFNRLLNDIDNKKKSQK